MATMKRRVIYMDDEAWADIEQWAQHTGRSISAAIRDAIDTTIRERGSRTHTASGDDITMSVGRFNRRPFTPVPKGK